MHRTKRIVIAVGACAILYAIGQFSPEAPDYKAGDKELGEMLARAAALTATSTTTAPMTFPIHHVVDGDTLVVSVRDGVFATIRLIGMNTPETVDPRKPVECFGPEASARAHALFDNGSVGLVSDSAEGALDIYGRVLAYAYLPDGTLYDQMMIASGYAYEYTFKTKYAHQKDFRAAQAAAKKSKIGLWSPATCNGKKRLD